MRLLKQLTAFVLIVTVLVLPLGAMGCAQNASTGGGAGDGSGQQEPAPADTEPDLGEPEGGTQL